ncbi:MAG: hypothetical protein HY791_36050 [Deltaproteobacteria bacterium]|nr:hypothetical protein [Deltaproteobacteria bacterium]
MRTSFLASLLLVLSACATELDPIPAASNSDARAAVDGGGDGSTSGDASLSDAGSLDAVVQDDSGSDEDSGPLQDARPSDSGPSDSGPECAGGCLRGPEPTCSGTDLIEHERGRCEPTGCVFTDKVTPCALGCCTDHCCAVRVSNQADFGRLPDSTGITTGANGVFDTESDCEATSSLGECAFVSAGTISACVCRSDELIVQDLTVVGPRALVLLASRKIEIMGTLDVAGHGTENGSGVSYIFNLAASGTSGGRGGSFGTEGGGGGPAAHGSQNLVPLYGGMRGQNICAGSALGGGGGGAVQISAGQEVRISGSINASGGGGGWGRSGDSCNGGGGGGSGGGILLEAPRVELSGATKIVANGGGGGSGGGTDNSGNSGSDGLLGSDPASGGPRIVEGTCPLYPDIYSGSGGNGGALVTLPEPGGSGDSETRCLSSAYTGDGGGGGSVGRIRINTVRGRQGCTCLATLSPEPTFGNIAAE